MNQGKNLFSMEVNNPFFLDIYDSREGPYCLYIRKPSKGRQTQLHIYNKGFMNQRVLVKELIKLCLLSFVLWTRSRKSSLNRAAQEEVVGAIPLK